MEYCVIVLGTLILLFVIWAMVLAYKVAQLKKSIRKKGGMNVMFKPLIDGVLLYQDAKAVEVTSNTILLKGSFYNPPTNVLCGFWYLYVYRSWNKIGMWYIAHADIGLGWIRKSWSFDVMADQQYILRTIKPIMETWVGKVHIGEHRMKSLRERIFDYCFNFQISDNVLQLWNGQRNYRIQGMRYLG